MNRRFESNGECAVYSFLSVEGEKEYVVFEKLKYIKVGDAQTFVKTGL